MLKMEESISEEEPTTSTSTSTNTTRGSTPTTSDDVESSYNLVKKHHTISLDWKYFSVKANDKGVPIESELDGPICNPAEAGTHQAKQYNKSLQSFTRTSSQRICSR